MKHRDATDSYAVQAEGLAKSYRTPRVLDGVDLMVPRGSVFALLGPQECRQDHHRPHPGDRGAADVGRARWRVSTSAGSGGESGADQPDRAECRDRRTADGHREPPDDGPPHLSHRARTEGRARDPLRAIRFPDAGGRPVATYSGGMRRRLDLACGLVGRPAVLFLDEPTTGLDLHSRQAMWQLIADLVRSGVGSC